MNNPICLSRLEWEHLFCSPQHVQVFLRKIPGSQIIWLNQRVMWRQRGFLESTGSVEARRESILRSCGYAIAEFDGADGRMGIVDRYGGSGIGANGGSGRAAFFNGYYIKGIGRTPLIGRETEAGHASGGAYLEECVRETIFAELVEAEFPHGSVPTVAIIDTGMQQVWEQFHPSKIERKCLLVRPRFLRPAHFERAAAFLGHDEKEGYQDRRRVEHMMRTARELFGLEGFLAMYREFWLAWAEQLAYAFVHRLPHGGDTTSNIAFDGRLLDFGAMASVPTWARVSLELGSPPVGGSMACLIDAIRLHAVELGRHIESAEATPEGIAKIARLAAHRYQFVVRREILRVAGLSCRQAELLLASKNGAELGSILGRVWTHFRREHFAIFDGTPEPRIPWDVNQLWSDRPPEYLRRLREFLTKHVDLFRGDERKDSALRTIVGRCSMRTRTRPELYRERIKRTLFRMLETELAGNAANQNSLDELISAIVCCNRRDSKAEPEGAIPIGFARNADVGFALFRCLYTARDFAVKDGGSFCTVSQGENDAQPVADEQPERLYITSISSGSILFASSAVREFSGSVWLL